MPRLHRFHLLHHSWHPPPQTPGILERYYVKTTRTVIRLHMFYPTNVWCESDERESKYSTYTAVPSNRWFDFCVRPFPSFCHWDRIQRSNNQQRNTVLDSSNFNLALCDLTLYSKATCKTLTLHLRKMLCWPDTNVCAHVFTVCTQAVWRGGYVLVSD